jgi:hypothetical protein
MLAMKHDGARVMIAMEETVRSGRFPILMVMWVWSIKSGMKAFGEGSEHSTKMYRVTKIYKN